MKYITLVVIIIMSALQLSALIKKKEKSTSFVYIALMLIALVYVYGLTSYWEIKTPDALITKIFDPLARRVFTIGR